MILKFEHAVPNLAAHVFVAPTATVVGNVGLGESVSVWYGAVLRGDVGLIRVGARSNIQDQAVVHLTTGLQDALIGADVTVGHSAVIHGCIIHDKVLVGMGAIVLDRAVVHPYCIIGAGSVVTPGTMIPQGSMVLGSPAKVVRPLRSEERMLIDASAIHYVELAERHRLSATPVDNGHR